jgi:hypothetical protein
MTANVVKTALLLGVLSDHDDFAIRDVLRWFAR